MIDTHQHLIKPDRFSYPWLADAPKLQGDFDLRRYSAEAELAGITGSIFVEVDVAQDDQAAEAQHFCELADDPSNNILGIVASCRPEHDNFQDHLQRIKHSKLVGLRRVLHVADNTLSQSSCFQKNVASLADHNLTFDLCVRADQLLMALELVNATPQTNFILDHCGNPPLSDKNGMANWQEDIAHLADLPNVFCKVSGLVNHLPPPTSTNGAAISQSHAWAELATRSLYPVVEYVAAHFGPERLLFGGDWPVCLLAGVDLSSWTDVAKALLSSQSQKVQRAFFSENAQRIYNL